MCPSSGAGGQAAWVPPPPPMGKGNKGTVECVPKGKGMWGPCPYPSPGAYPFVVPTSYASNPNRLAEAWQNGWDAGNAKGYRDGVAEGIQLGMKSIARESDDGWPCDDDGGTGGGGGDGSAQKKKQKGKKGACKEFRALYTDVAEDDDGPHYMVKLGKGMYATYPQEIQDQLREMANVVEDGAVELEYDMTGGYVFILRHFPESEKEAGGEVLAKHTCMNIIKRFS